MYEKRTAISWRHLGIADISSMILILVAFIVVRLCQQQMLSSRNCSVGASSVCVVSIFSVMLNCSLAFVTTIENCIHLWLSVEHKQLFNGPLPGTTQVSLHQNSQKHY